MRIVLVAVMPLALQVGQAFAVEAVILSSKVDWNCQGDVQVQLNDDNGNLRIVSKSAGVDHTLPFHGCH